MNIERQQYLAQWHDSFVNYTAQMSSFVDGIKLLPETTDVDKIAIDGFKALLHRKDVLEVEKDLANGIVKQNTLDKLEKLDKDIIDFAVEHISSTPAFKEILKQIFYHLIEWNKQGAVMRLSELKISLL